MLKITKNSLLLEVYVESKIFVWWSYVNNFVRG